MYNSDKYHNLYFDAEFTGLHRNTTLISIGVYSDLGSVFYAEFNDYDKSQVTDWIQDNVIHNLIFDEKFTKYTDVPKSIIASRSYGYNMFMRSDTPTIKEELSNFIKKEYERTSLHQIKDWSLETLLHLILSVRPKHKRIQFVSDCYAYDWMLLADLLWGNGLDLPAYTSYIPIDISTMFSINDIDPDINREEYADIKSDDPFFSILRKVKLVDNNQYLDLKHNSMWDAYVISKCYNKICRGN
jgi:hypothetical protein